MSSRVCLIIYDLPVYISSCLFSLMSSGLLVIPGVSCLVLSCPALMSLLNIIIWVYIFVRVFLFLPRVCTVTQNLCSAFNPFKCTRTEVNTYTHMVNTHPEQCAAILLWHPGSSRGFGALLEDLTSFVVLKMEESAGYSLQNQNGLIIETV